MLSLNNGSILCTSEFDKETPRFVGNQMIESHLPNPSAEQRCHWGLKAPEPRRISRQGTPALELRDVQREMRSNSANCNSMLHQFVRSSAHQMSSFVRILWTYSFRSFPQSSLKIQ